MCTNNLCDGKLWSPEFPVATDEMITMCFKMRTQIEDQSGSNFLYYQPLMYRRSAWLSPVPGGGTGPVIPQYDLLIKIATAANAECLHMVVHHDETEKTDKLLAFQLHLPVNSQMYPMYVIKQ